MYVYLDTCFFPDEERKTRQTSAEVDGSGLFKPDEGATMDDDGPTGQERILCDKGRRFLLILDLLDSMSFISAR